MQQFLYFGGLCQLSAWLQSAILYGVQVSTAGIDGCCVPCWAAAYNDTFYVFHI